MSQEAPIPGNSGSTEHPAPDAINAALALLRDMRKEIVSAAGWALLEVDRELAHAATRAWNQLNAARSADEVDVVLKEMTTLTARMNVLAVKRQLQAQGVQWDG